MVIQGFLHQPYSHAYTKAVELETRIVASAGVARAASQRKGLRRRTSETKAEV